MTLLRILIPCAILATVTAGFCASESLGQTDRRYLAVDATQRVLILNATVTNHQAQYVGPAIELDQPWEQDLRIIYPGSTVQDPVDGLYRMYYEVVIGGEAEVFLRDRHVAMATSVDGVNWVKPALNITGNDYSNSSQNNFVSIAGTLFANGPNVFIDPTAADNERYKATYRDFTQFDGRSLISAVSSDGINFNPVGEVDNAFRLDIGLDSHNVAFWDPIDSEYKAYNRYWYRNPFRRGVSLKRSDQWEGYWSTPRQLVIDPQGLIADTRENQFYTPGISTYHGQYIGLPSIYHDATTDGRIETGFLHSLDGENWNVSEGGPAIVNARVHFPDGDDYQIYAQPSIIERDEDLLIYYSYLNRNHDDDDSFANFDFEGGMHIASLRRDGFASIDSNRSGSATWITDAMSLTCYADLLKINAIVNGSLSAEVRNAQTLAVIPGFSLSESIPLSEGDYLDGELHWTSGRPLAELTGQDVRFMFQFEDSSVFSFTITTNAEPSTGVLKGDINLDGCVNFLDISAFIAVLGGDTYQTEADTDCNGFVDFLDIAAFIAILATT